MNKLIIREAIRDGFTIRYNSIIYKSPKVELNEFSLEINNLHFTHAIQDSINIYKESFLPEKNISSNWNININIL